MNVTFRQLQVFVEVARQGSVVRASEQLHLTSPAVSMQIKAIEQAIGQVLFDRAGRRMTLTAAGEYFVVHARRLLAGLRDAEDAMARFDRLEGGQLTIAMVSAAKYFLPRLLARFRADHPSVAVRLKLGTREQIDEFLADNEVDLCVTGRPPRKVPVLAQPFAVHPHVLIMSPAHRLAQAERIPAAALAVEPFIVREPGSGTRSALSEYLDRHHLEVQIAMEMASNEAIKQAVMADMGVSLVSQHIIALEWSNGLIAAPAVEGLPLQRRWHVVYAASKHLSGGRGVSRLHPRRRPCSSRGDVRGILLSASRRPGTRIPVHRAGRSSIPRRVRSESPGSQRQRPRPATRRKRPPPSVASPPP